MIPRPLVEPFPVGTGRRPPRRLALMSGFAFVGLAGIGALVWVMTLTPFSYHRFDAFQVGTTRGGDLLETIGQPGSYLVFEERAGASRPDLPPPVTIGVTSRKGDIVQVEMLVPPATEASPYAYRTPWHEGRAIARFTISEPGEYHIRAMPVSRSQVSGYRARLARTKLALGQESTTTWLGGWAGASVFIAAPLSVGLLLLVVARRRRRREHDSPVAVSASGVDSGHLAVATRPHRGAPQPR